MLDYSLGVGYSARMGLLDVAAAVFIGNMITVAWAYSMNHIIKASNEGRAQSPYALFGMAGPLVVVILFLLNA
jgi:hypothetical protein